MSMYYMMFVLSIWMLVMPGYCHGKEYIDLSHDIGANSAIWPSSDPYIQSPRGYGYQPSGFWFEGYHVCMSEHTSTHMDSPSHLAQGKWTIDQIPQDHLFGPGIVIDIQDKVLKDPNAELTAEDVVEWMDEHGPLPDGVIVFVRTGWASRYGNQKDYYGTATNDTSNLIFPGINNGAAQLLVAYEEVSGRKVVGVGIDTPSLDHGPSKDYPSHQSLFEANIYGLENVASLDKLPAKGFDVIVMPAKFRGGSGAPARIFAILPGGSLASAVNNCKVTLILAAIVLCGRHILL